MAGLCDLFACDRRDCLSDKDASLNPVSKNAVRGAANWEHWGLQPPLMETASPLLWGWEPEEPP